MFTESGVGRGMQLRALAACCPYASRQSLRPTHGIVKSRLMVAKRNHTKVIDMIKPEAEGATVLLPKLPVLEKFVSLRNPRPDLLMERSQAMSGGELVTKTKGVQVERQRQAQAHAEHPPRGCVRCHCVLAAHATHSIHVSKLPGIRNTMCPVQALRYHLPAGKRGIL